MAQVKARVAQNEIEDLDSNRVVAEMEGIAVAYGHGILDPLPDEDVEFQELAVAEGWHTHPSALVDVTDEE